MTEVQRFRIQRGATHLCALGPRALAELLIAIAERHALTRELLEALDDWRRLDPTALHAVLRHYSGGREFAPSIAAMEGGRR